MDKTHNEVVAILEKARSEAMLTPDELAQLKADTEAALGNYHALWGALQRLPQVTT